MEMVEEAVSEHPKANAFTPPSAGPQVTRTLPAPDNLTPTSVAELLEGGPSSFGYHAVSEYLACPEASRLRNLGVRKKGAWQPGMELDALGKGLLWHALIAYRDTMDTNAALQVLSRITDIGESDRIWFIAALKVYELTFPQQFDPWTSLGIECEVCSDVGDGAGGSLLRTVRYDKVVAVPETGVFSLERKTSARGGGGSMSVYTPQAAVQVAVWNANPYLVERYGQMRGIIFDVMVKTRAPSAERIGPKFVPRVHQTLAVEYLRQTERIKYQTNEDGTFPRMLHACWGKYSPCQYVDLCWEQSYGDYEQIAA